MWNEISSTPTTSGVAPSTSSAYDNEAYNKTDGEGEIDKYKITARVGDQVVEFSQCSPYRSRLKTSVENYDRFVKKVESVRPRAGSLNNIHTGNKRNSNTPKLSLIYERPPSSSSNESEKVINIAPFTPVGKDEKSYKWDAAVKCLFRDGFATFWGVLFGRGVVPVYFDFEKHADNLSLGFGVASLGVSGSAIFFKIAGLIDDYKNGRATWRSFVSKLTLLVADIGVHVLATQQLWSMDPDAEPDENIKKLFQFLSVNLAFQSYGKLRDFIQAFQKPSNNGKNTWDSTVLATIPYVPVLQLASSLVSSKYPNTEKSDYFDKLIYDGVLPAVINGIIETADAYTNYWLDVVRNKSDSNNHQKILADAWLEIIKDDSLKDVDPIEAKKILSGGSAAELSLSADEVYKISYMYYQSFFKNMDKGILLKHIEKTELSTMLDEAFIRPHIDPDKKEKELRDKESASNYFILLRLANGKFDDLLNNMDPNKSKADIYQELSKLYHECKNSYKKLDMDIQIPTPKIILEKLTGINAQRSEFYSVFNAFCVLVPNLALQLIFMSLCYQCFYGMGDVKPPKEVDPFENPTDVVSDRDLAQHLNEGGDLD